MFIWEQDPKSSSARSCRSVCTFPPNTRSDRYRSHVPDIDRTPSTKPRLLFRTHFLYGPQFTPALLPRPSSPSCVSFPSVPGLPSPENSVWSLGPRRGRPYCSVCFRKTPPHLKLNKFYDLRHDSKGYTPSNVSLDVRYDRLVLLLLLSLLDLSWLHTPTSTSKSRRH